MKPKFEDIANGFTYDLSEIEKIDIYSKVIEAYNEGYEDGYTDGDSDAKNDIDEGNSQSPEINEEAIGCAYVVDQFDGVNSFEDFQRKYQEMVRLNLNNTPPIGPTLFTK